MEGENRYSSDLKSLRIARSIVLRLPNGKVYLVKLSGSIQVSIRREDRVSLPTLLYGKTRFLKRNKVLYQF